MDFVKCADYEEISKVGADIIAAQVTGNKDSVLGLATGSTPVRMYEMLANMELDFSDVVTFNLDEYYPIKKSSDQSYDYFMKDKLFNHINIDMSNTHIPNGEGADPVAECAQYEKDMANAGGIDIQVLGLGQNGHIGFNEPDSFLQAYTHVTDLTQNTIDVNSKFFDKKEDVPTKALTMGLVSIMQAKKIIVLANGKAKAPIIRHLKSNKIDTNIPATMLLMHPDVTVIYDED